MQTRSFLFLTAMSCLALLTPIALARPSDGANAKTRQPRTRVSRPQPAAKPVAPAAPSRTVVVAPQTLDAPVYVVQDPSEAPTYTATLAPEASDTPAYVLLDPQAACPGARVLWPDLAGEARARRVAALDRLHMLVVPRSRLTPLYPLQTPLAPPRGLRLTPEDAAGARIVHPLLTPQVMARVAIVHPLLTPQIMAHVKTIPVSPYPAPASRALPTTTATPGPR